MSKIRSKMICGKLRTVNGPVPYRIPHHHSIYWIYDRYKRQRWDYPPYPIHSRKWFHAGMYEII